MQEYLIIDQVSKILPLLSKETCFKRKEKEKNDRREHALRMERRQELQAQALQRVAKGEMEMQQMMEVFQQLQGGIEDMQREEEDDVEMIIGAEADPKGDFELATKKRNLPKKVHHWGKDPQMKY